MNEDIEDRLRGLNAVLTQHPKMEDLKHLQETLNCCNVDYNEITSLDLWTKQPNHIDSPATILSELK